MSGPLRAHVHAVTSWTGAQGSPAATLLPSRLRRRTSTLTRTVAEVMSTLHERAGVDLATVATVYGSALGEISTTARLLEMMQEHDGELSPTRFHNSVHNTAAGTISIACGNRGFSTSIAAGPATVAAALIEAFGVLGTHADEVVVVVADEAVPAPLAPEPGYDALAVGLLLRSAGNGDGLGTLRDLRRATAPSSPTHQGPSAANPCAPALALVRALEHGQAKTVALELGPGAGAVWQVDVVPRRRAAQ